MQEGESLSDVAKTLSDIYGGSEQKAGKIFAMGFYQGLVAYDGDHEDHRAGQIASAAGALESQIERLIEASDDERSLGEVSREIRNEIGDIEESATHGYHGEHALLPYVVSFVTRDKLVGNHFIELGTGLMNRLDAIRVVKGDSQNGRYLREFKEIHQYLEKHAGDHA